MRAGAWEQSGGDEAPPAGLNGAGRGAQVNETLVSGDGAGASPRPRSARSAQHQHWTHRSLARQREAARRNCQTLGGAPPTCRGLQPAPRPLGARGRADSPQQPPLVLALPGSRLLQHAPHSALIHLQATRRTGGPGPQRSPPGGSRRGARPDARSRHHRRQGAARSPASDRERAGYALTWRVQPPGPRPPGKDGKLAQGCKTHWQGTCSEACGITTSGGAGGTRKGNKAFGIPFPAAEEVWGTAASRTPRSAAPCSKLCRSARASFCHSAQRRARRCGEESRPPRAQG